ncbi:MAG: hypothetical protein K5784_05915 [Clostridiales bacterium]|nr:hypothetical protein [Clostridiales bacterium]
MKKTLVWLSALLLILSLTACAEGSRAALTIGWFPPEACGRYSEFVPDEDTQNRLLELLADADFIDRSHDDRAFPDYNEVSLGISISYGGFSADLRTGGWIRLSEIGTPGFWFAQDKAIADLVTELLAGYGFEPFDPSGIKTVVSAQLYDGPYFSGKAHEPITLSDPDKLEDLTRIIGISSLAEPSECLFGYSKLVMTDSEGSVYELYPATDGCCRFFINGCFFGYDASRGGDTHDADLTLFELFGIEPLSHYHAPK